MTLYTPDSHLTSGLFLGIVGAVFLWIAARFHFFRIKSLPHVALNIRYPIIGVIGYLVVYFVVAPFTIRFIGKSLPALAEYSPALYMTLLQTLSILWVIAYLFLLSILQDKTTLHAMWIHPSRSRFSCIMEDMGLGVLTWLVAFPIVGAVTLIMEFLTYVLTGLLPVEQVAIRFLKMARGSPILLTLALFTILIAAPVIEELVFRGFLYSYLRKKLSMVKALPISALIFSFLHFSPDQGGSNIPLLSSLFVLALFLGFLYERQRSLFAPIALHMTFNSVSVIRILLAST